MTRLLSAGAEEMSPSALWTSVSASNDVSVVNTEGDQRAVGYYWTPRTGWALYRLELDEFMSKTLNNPTEIYCGFAFKNTVGTASYRFCMVGNTAAGGITQNLNLRQEGTGQVALYRTSTQLAISAINVCLPGSWHYIEVWFKPLNSSGRVTVKVDGSTVIDFTGDTTADQEYCSVFRLYGTGNDLNACYFDDVVVNDTAGSVNNTWPGQVRLLPILPRADGSSSQWSRAGVDMGANWRQARYPTGAYTLVQETTAEEEDLYLMDAPDIPAGATIVNVISQVKGRVQGGAGKIAQIIRANTTDGTDSADKTLSASFQFFEEVWAINPATSVAWVEADLATLQLGIKART